MIPSKMKFDNSHYLYELFIKFHSGQLSNEARQAAKVLLHPIHYGNLFDTDDAFKEAAEVRAKLNNVTKAQ
jgi:hypothetical protein